MHHASRTTVCSLQGAASAAKLVQEPWDLVCVDHWLQLIYRDSVAACLCTRELVLSQVSSVSQGEADWNQQALFY